MVDVSALLLGALVIVVIFFLRPSTITDIAHSLGRAAAEFRRGQHDEPSQEPSDDLKRVAQKLGINVEGKSADQLTQLIVARTQQGK